MPGTEPGLHKVPQSRGSAVAAPDRRPPDVAAEFYTSAALGLLVWWIDHDFCGHHAWLTGLYRKLAAPDRFAPS